MVRVNGGACSVFAWVPIDRSSPKLLRILASKHVHTQHCTCMGACVLLVAAHKRCARTGVTAPVAVRNKQMQKAQFALSNFSRKIPLPHYTNSVQEIDGARFVVAGCSTVLQIGRYVDEHKKLFGKYRYGLPPKPTEDMMSGKNCTCFKCQLRHTQLHISYSKRRGVILRQQRNLHAYMQP